MRLFIQKRTLLVVIVAFTLTYCVWSFILAPDYPSSFSPPPADLGHYKSDDKTSPKPGSENASPNDAGSSPSPSTTSSSSRFSLLKGQLGNGKDIARLHKSLENLDRIIIDSLFPSPPKEAANASHLVIVPGHAIFLPRAVISPPADIFDSVLPNNSKNSKRDEDSSPPKENDSDKPSNEKKTDNNNTDDVKKDNSETAAHKEASSPNEQSEYREVKLNVFSNTKQTIDYFDESNWLVAPFQRGQIKTFVKHIQLAARIARKDPNAILVFSGGQTNFYAGPYSEGASYWSLAANVLGEYDIPDTATPKNDNANNEPAEDYRGAKPGQHLVNRMIAEEYATDSYENLLFSIARFREYVGKYPELITVVGLDFKKERFTDVHRAALRFPASRFRYVGVDPPEFSSPADDANTDQEHPGHGANDRHGVTDEEIVDTDENKSDDEALADFVNKNAIETKDETKDKDGSDSKKDEDVHKRDPDAAILKSQRQKNPAYIKALLGERKNALEPFKKDPYGCHNELLLHKKRLRNPFRRTHSYILSCPELYDLFTICARDNVPESIFKNLPWNSEKAPSIIQ